MKIFTVIVLALVVASQVVFFGCRPKPINRTSQTTVIAQTDDIIEFEWKGHRYLRYNHQSSPLIHAEHCQCKNAWNTNAALNNLFLKSMLPAIESTNAISP